MNLSNRHHYVPKFLIKNFCDTDEKLWIYDKQTGQIGKHKRSPKSIFFEWGRNLFNVNGQTVDNIEKMYGEVDDLLARTLERVLKTESMTGRELTLLILLVSLTKWRIPKADGAFDTLADQTAIENLGMAIRPVNSTEKMSEEAALKLENEEIIKATKRLLFPLQPIVNEASLNEIHQNCFLVTFDEFPALIGDCPIIESSEPKGLDELGNFIFPISSNVTLVCKRNAEKYISNKLFYIQRDLTIFHLANQYVGCKSKDHLEKIVETYKIVKNENKTNLLEKYVFEFIK